jgi:HlyD family secretion protein
MSRSRSIRITSCTVGTALALALVACGEAPEEASRRVVPVTTRDIVVSATAAGIVEPVTTLEVKSKASGEIIEVLVEEGEGVQRGELLVRVDPRIPRNAVDQAAADSVVARAELDNAEARLERAESLHDSQSITDEEYESAKLARATAFASLVRARRALEDAKIAFEDTEVRAPTSGTVLSRNVEVGTVIASASREVGGGTVLLRMAQLDTVQVRALVDETDIGKIRPGMPVTITVESFPNRPFTGDVLRIGAEALVEQNVTMFPVLVQILNANGLLRPGMNAEVEIHIGSVENALAVPNAALRSPNEVASTAAQLGLSVDGASDGPQDRRGDGSRPPAETSAMLSPEDGEGLPASGAPVPSSSAVSLSGADATAFGGRYVVFAVRDGKLTAVTVRTGLTDFEYTAVLDGLEPGDSVLVLQSAGLMEDQAQRQQWIRERVGGPLPTGTR